MRLNYSMLDNVEYAVKRLNAILTRRRLLFNPYTVSDRELLEKLEQSRWGNTLDIVEAVILRFTRLHIVRGCCIEGIYFRVGDDPTEILITAYNLKKGLMANGENKILRQKIGSRVIRNDADIEYLLGKTVFVSHVLRGINTAGRNKVAYRMHRLYGKPSKDAKIIREAMIKAKIEMLERVIAIPEDPDYLCCRRGVFTYIPQILEIIERVKRYPEIVPPEE